MVLKCAVNNICNTVMSGQGPSSSGGPLRSVKMKPGREEAYVINYAFYMWICLYIYSAFFSVRLP